MNERQTKSLTPDNNWKASFEDVPRTNEHVLSVDTPDGYILAGAEGPANNKKFYLQKSQDYKATIRAFTSKGASLGSVDENGSASGFKKVTQSKNDKNAANFKIHSVEIDSTSTLSGRFLVVCTTAGGHLMNMEELINYPMVIKDLKYKASKDIKVLVFPDLLNDSYTHNISDNATEQDRSIFDNYVADEDNAIGEFTIPKTTSGDYETIDIQFDTHSVEYISGWDWAWGGLILYMDIDDLPNTATLDIDEIGDLEVRNSLVYQVDVQLKNGDTVLDTQTLKSANNWTHTWENQAGGLTLECIDDDTKHTEGGTAEDRVFYVVPWWRREIKVNILGPEDYPDRPEYLMASIEMYSGGFNDQRLDDDNDWYYKIEGGTAADRPRDDYWELYNEHPGGYTTTKTKSNHIVTYTLTPTE